MWEEPKHLMNGFYLILFYKITKRKNIFPMKKLIITASGIVLKEYLPYQFNLCTGTNPQSVP